MALLCMCELSSAKQHMFFCCCCLSCVQCGLLFLKLQGFEKHCRFSPRLGNFRRFFKMVVVLKPGQHTFYYIIKQLQVELLFFLCGVNQFSRGVFTTPPEWEWGFL